MSDDSRSLEAIAKAIAMAGSEISFGLSALAEAIKSLVPPKPKADKLILLYQELEQLVYIKGGKFVGAPISGHVGNTASPTVLETAAGVPVAPVGPLAYASDNTAIVTVDPTTGVATMVAPGTANVSVIDQGNGLTDTVAFTVAAAPPPIADKLTLSYTLNPTSGR